MALGADPRPDAPGAPAGLKLSNGGNWKGSETGTRPPNIPKPRGRAEGPPRREAPAVPAACWGGTPARRDEHKEGEQGKCLFILL